MKRIFSLNLLLLIFAVSGCVLTSGIPDTSGNQKIRIALCKDADRVVIHIRGRYRMIDPVTERILEEGRRLKATPIVSWQKGIQIGKRKYESERIRFIADKDIGIRVGRRGSKRYRGSTDIIRNRKGGLLVVNRLGIEDYVRGILYHEASPRWPMEALKVQAVAARSYALYQIQVNTDQEYDVTSGIYSQVYGGRSAERYRTNLAVQRTNGRIMRFENEIFPSYYHSTCGGFSEDVRELWEHKGLSLLRGVRCDFCTRSPHYRWRRNFRVKDIQDALNVRGYRLGLIKEIRVLSRNKSGRIKDLKITTRNGKSIVIPGKDFRDIVGPNRIKSNDYRVVMQGYYCDLIGKGWGHGVGMCQWGALGMARQRHSYETILRYYYPGVDITGI